MKEKKKFRLFPILAVCAALMLFFCLIRAWIVVTGNEMTSLNVSSSNSGRSSIGVLADGWILTYEDGSSEPVSLPTVVSTEKGESISLSHEITEDLQGTALLFDNYRYGITISTEAGLLYSANETKIASQVRYYDLRIVQLPDEEACTELIIAFDGSADGVYEIREISYGPMSVLQMQILQKDAVTALLLLLFVILGIVIFLAALLSGKSLMEDKQIFDLLIFLVTAFFWGLTDSNLSSLIGIPQEISGLLCYFMLAGLPIPMCHFVWVSCGKKYRLLRFANCLSAANLILQGLFGLSGLLPMHGSFYISHLLCVFVILSGLHCTTVEQRKENRGNGGAELRIQYWGCVLLGIFSLLCIIFYWFFGAQHYRNTLLIGILGYIIFLFASVVYRFVRVANRQHLAEAETEAQERLAHYDAMTGLRNRRSFEEKMSEISDHFPADRDAVLYMMDVNGLKYTNDKYGHAAGDDLIVSAAKAIAGAYDSSGTCYRIGGDEFVVVITELENVSLVTLEEDFRSRIEENNQNTRWKLAIAVGESHLLRSNGQRITVSDWKQEADVNMYLRKSQMSSPRSRTFAKDLQSIIDCVVRTVEAKDIYTASHSERVARISSLIGEKMGLSDTTQELLELSAHLHDIGKIGVPDRVLLKSGRLTDEEARLMREHPVIGASIIGDAQGLKDIADVVLHHHERYDGLGYPSGLKGEEIPLSARIIAVADSIDAMTSKRIYRESMSLDDCRKEIEKNIGKMYDPAIAQITLEHWKEVEQLILLHPKRLRDEIPNG